MKPYRTPNPTHGDVDADTLASDRLRPPSAASWEYDVPAWRLDGACANTKTAPDLFFPPRGQNAPLAKAICHTCTVRLACLSYALDHAEQFGVWGGTTVYERNRMRRGRAA